MVEWQHARCGKATQLNAICFGLVLVSFWSGIAQVLVVVYKTSNRAARDTELSKSIREVVTEKITEKTFAMDNRIQNIPANQPYPANPPDKTHYQDL